MILFLIAKLLIKFCRLMLNTVGSPGDIVCAFDSVTLSFEALHESFESRKSVHASTPPDSVSNGANAGQYPLYAFVTSKHDTVSRENIQICQKCQTAR